MKNSKKCPKCQSSDILRIPGELTGVGNVIRTGWTAWSTVTVTRYLCGSCGFIEEWIDTAADIARVKKKYA